MGTVTTISLMKTSHCFSEAQASRYTVTLNVPADVIEQAKQ